MFSKANMYELVEDEHPATDSVVTNLVHFQTDVQRPYFIELQKTLFLNLSLISHSNPTNEDDLWAGFTDLGSNTFPVVAIFSEFAITINWIWPFAIISLAYGRPSWNFRNLSTISQNDTFWCNICDRYCRPTGIHYRFIPYTW